MIKNNVELDKNQNANFLPAIFLEINLLNLSKVIVSAL